jgi:hypothetical protein
MKNLIFGIIAIITFSNSCISQNTLKSEAVGEPKIFIEDNSLKSEEFKASESSGFKFFITVAADFVGVVGTNCWTVNVRVYFNTEEGSVLMANQNVNVGSGCGQNRLSNNSLSNCPTVEYKGDLILENKDSYKYCLIELLRDENIYSVYDRMKKEFIKRNEQK